MPDPHQPVIDEFRANGGQVGGRFADITLLLLTTTGARSGLQRTTALTYSRAADGRYVVLAANGGRERAPDWYHNLVAHPSVTLEVGAETFAAVAATVTEPERTSLMDTFVAENPQANGFMTETRVIPVVTFTRI